MRVLRSAIFILAVLAVAPAYAAAPGVNREDYDHEPMPAGIQVVATELEGPVFADAQGKTLYVWPRKNLRNGDAGEQKERPTCDATRYTETAGLMSPYPGGLTLPDAATRPSCISLWPAVLAPVDAKPIGKFTILDRKDGGKQWAYDGYALYTSVLDEVPGDTRGGTKRRTGGDAPAYREPVGPRPNIPAQFGVFAVAQGRLLGTAKGYSVYTYDKDTAAKSNCAGECLREWEPVLAAEAAVPRGEWTKIERLPGVLQWAFRGKPLYTRIDEDHLRSLEGADVPGWHNVFTQHNPPPPKAFTVQDAIAGQVLADAQGRTVYIYNCGDDAVDQLACDHPGSPQAYRFAVCGGGDPARCLATFPYVIADRNAKSDSRAWTTMDIDPTTGGSAAPGQAGALHVWAFRGRPVYRFFKDQKPGEVNADGWGEFNGIRNGFKAFWLRDDFRNNAG